ITVNEFVLGVTQSYASYQWMDESGDIPGATNATYTVTSNGKYSVRATDANGCESTSDIYEVTNVSVHSVDGWSHVYIYPNPAKDVLHVASPVPVIVSVRSIDGRLLFETTAAGTIDMAGITPGIYLLSISDMNG